MYADLDVECHEPIDTWTPVALQGKPGVVIGIEADRKPVENDAKLYYDHREHIWGITNWTFTSKRGHPFMRFVAERVAQNLREVAQKQEWTLSTMELSYKEVIDATGPRAFSEAFLAYASRVTGTDVTYADATMLEEPKMIDDILILPIRAMSIAEADRTVEGAHSPSWPAVIYHWSAGTWKSNQRLRRKDKEWTHWTENCQRHGDITGYGNTTSFVSISDNEEPCWSIKLKPQGRGSLDSMNLDIFLVPHSFTLQHHESREVCVD